MDLCKIKKMHDQMAAATCGRPG